LSECEEYPSKAVVGQYSEVVLEKAVVVKASERVAKELWGTFVK